MGCDWSCYPAGFPGPVRDPAPAEPEVVGIDYERQLPANKSIYVGESARFLLVFDPVEFICNENDFSTSDDDVTVTMEEGADNVIRISVGETVGAGSVVEVRFRDQLIMNVTAVPNVRIVSFDGEDTPADISVDQGSLEFKYSFDFDDPDYVPSIDDFKAPEGVELYLENSEYGPVLTIAPITRTEPFAIYFFDQLIANVNVIRDVDVTVSSLNLASNGGKTRSNFGNSPEVLINNLVGAWIRVITDQGASKAFYDGTYEPDYGYIRFSEESSGEFIYVAVANDPETGLQIGDIVNASSVNITLQEYRSEDKIFGNFVLQS